MRPSATHWSNWLRVVPRRSAEVGRSINLKPDPRIAPRAQPPLVFGNEHEMFLWRSAIGTLVGQLLGPRQEEAAIGAAPDKLHSLRSRRHYLSRLCLGDVHS